MLFGGLALHTLALADATIPTKDIAGAKDHPALKRYEGSFIVSARNKAFDEFALPLSPLEKTERTDRNNNRVFAPRQAKDIEGALTRLVYVLPAGRTPVEVSRNYRDEITAAGGEVLFECKADACGGETRYGIESGGGNTGLNTWLYPPAQITDAAFSTGRCAVASNLAEQRYFSARLPVAGGEAYVALLTYTLKDGGNYCKALDERTIALLQVVDVTARESKMVTVKAEEMASAIGKDGRVALYGIYFDTGKADIKPESTPTLEQIGMLMKSDPKLKLLVVGHTDNAGEFDYNISLSKRRAQAVAAALTVKHGVAAARLRADGVGMLAPTASNDSDEGRAKNRRVELVKAN
jgi:outer membrane protein OmpA-like peptidoglycan-associated protein